MTKSIIEYWKNDPEAVKRMGDIGDQIIQILVLGVKGPDEGLPTIIGVLGCIYENDISEYMSVDDFIKDIALGIKEYLGLDSDDPAEVH